MNDETQGKPLGPEDLAGLADVYPRELVVIPEWNRSVWVWAYDLAGERGRWNDMQAGQDESERINRGMIGRVIESVRVGGDMVDGRPPAALFNRGTHWQWLKGQPMGVIRRICEVSERLNGESFATQEQIASFFGLMAQVVPCLTHIGSHSGACTDCPRNSQPNCPSVSSQRLWLPTA